MGPFEKSVEKNYSSRAYQSEGYARLYVRYLSETQGITLAEAATRSLSRVLHHFQTKERKSGVITAFRGDFSQSENRKRNKKLEADLKRLKWGYSPIIGGWVEQDSGVSHEEESFVVSPPQTMPNEQFLKELAKLCKKYDQDGALVKLSDDTSMRVVEKNGSTFKVGDSWSFDAMADNYSKMTAGGQKGRKFKFECAGTSSVNTRRVIEQHFASQGE